MISRILGLLACSLPLIWGILSIFSGIEASRFSMVLGGLLFAIPSILIMMIIIVSYMEQKVNTKPSSNKEPT